MHYVNDINLVPKMGQIIKVQWPVSSAPINGMNHRPLSGADPGFQVRGGALKNIAPSGGRHENVWGISCENSRFYAKKADYRISLLPLTSNSKIKTVVSKLHCMSNL